MQKTLVTIGILATSLLYAAGAFADGAVGVIVDGQRDNCSVKRKDGQVVKCRANMDLYAGDVLTRSPDVKAVKIEWLAAPVTRAIEVNKTTVRIVAEAPADRKSIAALAANTIPFLKKLTLRSSMMMARNDAPCALFMLPMPGYNATLLPNETVVFSWPTGGTTFLIVDKKWYQHVRIPLSGERSVSLTPERIGIKQGETYTWQVDGSGSDEIYQIRLANPDYTTLVREGLSAIDKTTPEAEERTVRKAAYLQLLSDIYPKNLDLYWLSAQLIENTNHEAVAGLRLRIGQHLRMTLQYK